MSKTYSTEELVSKFRFKPLLFLLRALGAIVAARFLGYLYCQFPVFQAVVMGAVGFWLLCLLLTASSCFSNYQRGEPAVQMPEARALFILGIVAIVFAVGWQLEMARGLMCEK